MSRYQGTFVGSSCKKKCSIFVKTTIRVTHAVSKAFLVTVQMIPLGLVFLLNPYLDNARYAADPIQTTKLYLMTTIPFGLCIYYLCKIACNASFIEFRSDLNGCPISASRAISMMISSYWNISLVLICVLAYPCFLQLGYLTFSWVSFIYFNSHIVLTLLIMKCISLLADYHFLQVFFLKILRQRKLCGKKRGIRQKKKVEHYSKIFYLKCALKYNLPYVLMSSFMLIVLSTKSFTASQNNVITIVYFISLLLLKMGIQSAIRKSVDQLNRIVESYSISATLAISVLINCQIRVVLLHSDSSDIFAATTLIVGLMEIFLRYLSVSFAIRSIKKSESIHPVYAANVMGKLYYKTRTKVSLLIYKMEAEMISEYVAINLSFLIGCIISPYAVFSFEENNDIVNKFKLLAWQYLVEILVDIISHSIELGYPEVMKMLPNRNASKLEQISSISLVSNYCFLLVILSLVR